MPVASSIIADNAGAVTAGFSGTITDAAAEVALLDGLALRRGRGDGVFVGCVTGGVVDKGAADEENLAIAVNVVAVSATVKLHA